MKFLILYCIIFLVVCLKVSGALDSLAAKPNELRSPYAKLEVFRYFKKGMYDYKLYLPDTTIYEELQFKTEVEGLNTITYRHGLRLFSAHPIENGCDFYLVRE